MYTPDEGSDEPSEIGIDCKINSNNLQDRVSSIKHVPRKVQANRSWVSIQPTTSLGTQMKLQGNNQWSQDATVTQEFDGIKCPYCAHITSKTLEQHWRKCNLKIRFNYLISSYGKKWKQVLTEDQPAHISEHPKFHYMFADFAEGLNGDELKSVQELQKDLLRSNDIDPETLRGDYYCSFCRTDFTSFGQRFCHYQSCLGLKQHYENVQQQLQAHKDKATVDEQKKIQTMIDFRGHILRGLVDSVNLIKELIPVEKKAKEVWGNDYQEMLELHKQLHSKDYFKGAWLELVAGPIADAEGNPFYAQYTTRENLVSVLGKRRRCGPAKIAREVITKMKQELGISLTLAERRDIQAGNIKALLKKYLPEMLNIREWLKSFKDLKSSVPFKKVQEMFCDGFILPRLKKIFPKYSNMEAYLRGKALQVQNVCPGSVTGCVYVRLEDSANQFTQELVNTLNAMVADLKEKVTQNMIFTSREEIKDDDDQDVQEEENYDDSDIAADDIYIRQIDFTQDVMGFFISFNVTEDCKNLAKLLKISTTRDYKSFDSCLYLLREENVTSEPEELNLQKRLRFKLYNKLLHYLQSEQAKKKISMNLKGMLLPSNAFYQKLLKCKESGISRLEFSHYFYSFEEQKTLMNAPVYQDYINTALKQVNKLKQINYTVPFNNFWKSFWSACKSIFVFEKDTWAVIYAKNPISAYAGQAVKINSNKDKIDFIKRFAVPGKWSLIIDAVTGKTYHIMKKGKQVIQLPIQSLNCQHQQKYEFDLGVNFEYHLSASCLSQIELVTKGGTLLEFDSVVPAQQQQQRKRDKKAEYTKEEKGIDVTYYVLKHRTKKDRWMSLTQPEFDQCKFISTDLSGNAYRCQHCMKELKRVGKTKLFLYI